MSNFKTICKSVLSLSFHSTFRAITFIGASALYLSSELLELNIGFNFFSIYDYTYIIKILPTCHLRMSEIILTYSSHKLCSKIFYHNAAIFSWVLAMLQIRELYRNIYMIRISHFTRMVRVVTS